MCVIVYTSMRRYVQMAVINKETDNMPLTTSGYRTHAPFPVAIREALRQRRYSLTVVFPDGQKKTYKSITHFTRQEGKRLEYIRSRTIYAEMDIGDFAEAHWSDREGRDYCFQFTRIR